MNRLRQLFESIVYAGLKPDRGPSQPLGLRWLGPLQGPVERFLNGPPSNDPFYLTNRSPGQKTRLALVIAIPLVVVLGGVGLAAIGYFDDGSRLPVPSRQLTTQEIAAKMQPPLSRDIQLETNRDVQVVDVIAGGNRISGSLRNATTHVITDVEVIFDLADARGSRVGFFRCRVARIEPNSSATFQDAVPQANAAYALVREIRTQ